MIIDATSLVTNPLGQGGPQLPGNIIGIAVHHTGGEVVGAPILTEAQERAVIRAIDFQHTRPPQDFGGFGYHGIAFASGRAYKCGEGQRAHVKGRNHQLRGYVLHGNFVSVQPSDLQLSGLRELMQADFDKFGRVLEIRGHGQWALPGEGTECPGLVVPRDWVAFMQPPPLPMPDGWVASHNQVLCFNGNGEVVVAIGDWEGEFPGQVAKLFGGRWLWLRIGEANPDGSYNAIWSPNKGD